MKENFKKPFKELTFSDDFMFKKVMEDPKICKPVLECLMQHPIGELQETLTERAIQFNSDGKPIRLDLLTRDEANAVYDVEMQRLNKKSIESLELPKRSRYYQSSIDSDFLKKGYIYRKLPECNILFICTFDPFDRGISKYSFKSICMENKDIILEDESSRIFFNCTYKGNDIPHDLKDLYGYIDSGTVKGGLTEMIDNEVVKGRENELWSLEYIREANVLADVREEGREEGWNNGQKSIVKTMLAKGKTIEEIADLCDLSEDYVREVEKEVAEDTH